MVDLPSVGRRLVTTETPQSRVSAADVARPYQLLAGAVGDTGDAFLKISDDMQKAADITTVSRHLDKALTDAQALQEKANGDAGAFEKSWKQYVSSTLPTIPKKFRGEVEAKLIGMGGDTYRTMFANSADRVKKLALDAIDARIGTLSTQMIDLARRGQTGSAEFKMHSAEVDDLFRQKTENRLIAYSKESAAQDRDVLADKLVGAHVTGQLVDIYSKKGFAAAQKRAQEIYDDNSDGLDKVKKLKAIQEGLKSVKALHAADAEGRKDFRADVQTVTAALGDGSLEPDSALVTDLLSTADQFRDPLAKLSIISARAKARLNPLASMGLGDRLDFLGKLRGIESGGNVNAANPNSTARGPDQFLEGTWLDVIKRNRPDLAAGKSDAELLALRSDDELSGEMTIALARENNAALTAAGIPVTDANTYLAHFLGAGGAVAVLKASPDTPVSQLLDADAIAANKPVLEGKTAGEVQAWAARKMGGGGEFDGYTKGVIPAVKASIKDGLTDALATADSMLKGDTPLDATQLKDLVDAARIVDEAGTYDDVQKILVRAQTVATMQGLSVTDMGAVVEALRAPGPVGDEALRLAALDQAEQTQKRMADLLENNPRALGVQLGAIREGKPLDATNITPDAIAARQKESGVIEQMEESGPLKVFTPDEEKALGTAIQSGQGGNVYASLLGLDSEHLMATLPGLKDAIGGAARSTDPKRMTEAMAFLDTVWARAPLNAERLFGEDTINLLQDWQSGLRYYTGDDLAKKLQDRADPQYRKKREGFVTEGERKAREISVDALVGKFDEAGLFNSPGVPVDEMTRTMVAADFVELTGERFASSLDFDVAQSQAIERMKVWWRRSDVNGGRLTLYPPEITYQADSHGDHDWMKEQLAGELKERFGFVPEYSIIADRTTEADIDAGKPATYLVAVTNPETGQVQMVHDESRADGLLRYSWDRDKALKIDRATFLRRRDAILKPKASLGRGAYVR